MTRDVFKTAPLEHVSQPRKPQPTLSRGQVRRASAGPFPALGSRSRVSDWKVSHRSFGAVRSVRSLTSAVIMGISCLLALSSCQERQKDAPTHGSRPFSISILDTQACPLPEGVDSETQRILGVKVRVTSAHPGYVPANFFYASVLTKDGGRYLAELSGCKPVLSSPPLKPGESAEGFLNFPLPVDEAPEELVYAPNLEHTLGAESLLPHHLAQEVELP